MQTTRYFAAAMSLFAAAAFAETSAPAPEVKKFIAYDDAVIALTHVRVIDGSGAPAQAERTIVVRNGKIESIGDAAPPAGARVVDLAGRSAMPGLVGMHNHLMYTASINLDEDGKMPPPGFLVTELAFSAPRLYLASGVTTMRTTGSIEPYTDLNIRRLIDEMKMPGPHIDVTGPYLEGKDSFVPQLAVLTTPEQATKTVAFWAGEGVTSFKAYMFIAAPVLGAAIKEAHRHGLKLTGHLCSVDWHEAIALGIDNLEHGPVYADTEFVADKKKNLCPSDTGPLSWEKRDLTSAPVQTLIADLVKHHVAVTSTLPVFEASIATRPLLSPRQARMLSPESLRSYLAARARAGTRAGSAEKSEALLKKEMAFELAFVRAGGLLLAGPDPTGIGGVLPGFGDQREIELLVEAGFTPLEAIHIASANGAQFENRLDRIGTLAPGKNADIVIVRGDPSQHVADVENVELVFKDGIAYDPAKLIESVRGMVGIR